MIRGLNRSNRSALVTIALATLFLLAGFGTAPAIAAGTTLTPSPLKVFFPGTNVGTPSSAQLVTIINSNPSTVQIDTVTPSGDFSLSSDGCSGTQLTQSGLCTVSVVFTPSQSGTRTGDLTFTDSASNSPQVVGLSGKGIVVKPTYSPKHLSFGEQPVEIPSAGKTITLSNPNMNALGVTSVVASGDFSVSNDTCSGTQVPGKGTCTFNVIFDPTQTKLRSGTIVVTDNADSAQQTLSLSGTGIIESPSVTPYLSFGSVQVGTVSAPQAVTVSNPNVVALDFSSISISGPFSISANTCDGSVAASSSCQVSVTFNPTTGSNGTNQFGKLQIVDNGQRKTELVALSGIALGTPHEHNGPKLELQPKVLSFGQVGVGSTSASQTVTATNPSNTNSISVGHIAVQSPFVKTGDTCDGLIPAGGSCSVSVAFQPVSNGKVKEKKGLTFDDSSKNSPQHVKLEGFGIPGTPTPTPTATATATRTATATATPTATGTATATSTATGSSTPTATATATATLTATATNTATATATNSATATPTSTSTSGTPTATATATNTATATATNTATATLDLQPPERQLRPELQLQRRQPRNATATATATATSTATSTGPTRDSDQHSRT